MPVEESIISSPTATTTSTTNKVTKKQSHKEKQKSVGIKKSKIEEKLAVSAELKSESESEKAETVDDMGQDGQVSTTTTTTPTKNVYHRREAVCDRCRKLKRACFGVSKDCNNCLLAGQACVCSIQMIRKCKPKPVKVLNLPIVESTNNSFTKNTVSTTEEREEQEGEDEQQQQQQYISQLYESNEELKASVSDLTLINEQLTAENKELLDLNAQVKTEKEAALKELKSSKQQVQKLNATLEVYKKKLEEANNSLLNTLQKQTQSNLFTASRYLKEFYTKNNESIASRTFPLENKLKTTSSCSPSSESSSPSSSSLQSAGMENTNSSVSSVSSSSGRTSNDKKGSSPGTIFRVESFPLLQEKPIAQTQYLQQLHHEHEQMIGDLGFPSKISTIKNSIFLNELDKDFLKTLGIGN